MEEKKSIYDPRNEEDYDTWDVGMEPIPGDHTWHHESHESHPLVKEDLPPIDGCTESF